MVIKRRFLNFNSIPVKITVPGFSECGLPSYTPSKLTGYIEKSIQILLNQKQQIVQKFYASVIKKIQRRQTTF